MWDDPGLYDLENADDPAFDLGWWTRLLEAARPRRVLELACGTGRLTIPLARLGIAEEIVGLDSSAPFLARARERAAPGPADDPVAGGRRPDDSLPGDRRPDDPLPGSRLTFVEGDMRAPGVPGPFDLVIVPFNSLAYLLNPEDRLATLRAARALLASGGRFAFDLVAPRYDFLAEALGPCPPVRQDADHAAPGHGIARFLRSYVDTYDPRTQTLHSLNRYEIHHTDGRVEHRLADLDWHIYFPAELDALLAQSGLRPVTRDGGWDGEPWDPTSRRMLWVCEPA